jgi:hypothetical protein
MSDAFQMVPVPNQHVPAVYRLLADLASAPSLATQDAATGSGDFEWNEVALADLAEGRYTTTKVVTEVMDFLSEHVGEWFSQDDLADATGRTKSQLIVVWSKFGPHIKKRYGATTWPLDDKNGRELNPPRPATVHYSMNSDQALLWLTVRGVGATD